MNQEGGEVRLTRRQALDLSKERKGYDASGYAKAMANARASLRQNSNLRGEELTYAARRMVAGIYPNNEGEDLNLLVNAPMLTKPEAINAPTLVPAMASKNVRDNYNVRENNAIDQMVKATIQGKYGNGAARKEALGEYYKLVQEKVNSILRQKSNKPQQTTNKSTTNKPQPAYVNQNLAKVNAGNNDYSQPGSLRNVITYESDSLIAGYDENGNYYTIVPSKNTKYRRDKNGNLQVVVDKQSSFDKAYRVKSPLRQEGGRINNRLFRYQGDIAMPDENWKNQNDVQAEMYNFLGQPLNIPTKEGGYRMHQTPGAAYNSNGELVYTPEQWETIRSFHNETLPNANRTQVKNEKGLAKTLKCGGKSKKK